MHADGEYVVWQSVEELARIQIGIPEKSGECLKRRKYRAAARQETEAKPVFPRPMAAEVVEEEKSPAFPAKGWHLPRRHLIYRNLLRFASGAS